MGPQCLPVTVLQEARLSAHSPTATPAPGPARADSGSPGKVRAAGIIPSAPAPPVPREEHCADTALPGIRALTRLCHHPLPAEGQEEPLGLPAVECWGRGDLPDQTPAASTSALPEPGDWGAPQHQVCRGDGGQGEDGEGWRCWAGSESKTRVSTRLGAGWQEKGAEEGHWLSQQHPLLWAARRGTSPGGAGTTSLRATGLRRERSQGQVVLGVTPRLCSSHEGCSCHGDAGVEASTELVDGDAAGCRGVQEGGRLLEGRSAAARAAESWARPAAGAGTRTFIWGRSRRSHSALNQSFPHSFCPQGEPRGWPARGTPG